MTLGRCTCGEKLPVDRSRHYDMTGYCERGKRHQECDGNLNAATGFHWWCACKCHPEPEIFDTPNHHRALGTWLTAREALYA